MKKHYSIALPKLPGLPIRAQDYYTNKGQNITLKAAKDFVLGAILRGDTVILEKDLCNITMDVISIIDRSELMTNRAQWIEANSDRPLGEVMRDDVPTD
jgi:hypothetical protein